MIGLLEAKLPPLRRAALVIGMSPLAEKMTRRVWPRAAARAEAGDAPVLQLDNVRKSFGGLVAVDGLSFELRRGEILGLIGPNGSGKTTALNLISGAIHADSGEISLEGRPIAMLPAHRIAQRGVARTFQLVRVLGASTCRENVIAGLAFHAHAALGRGGRTPRAHAARPRRARATRPTCRQASSLISTRSGSSSRARWRCRPMCCCSTNGWPASIRPSLHEGIALVQMLREEGLTIIIVEHVMDAIRSLCDRCVVMNTGRKIAEGPPAAVLADREVIRAYLGDADA